MGGCPDPEQVLGGPLLDPSWPLHRSLLRTELRSDYSSVTIPAAGVAKYIHKDKLTEHTKEA